MSFRSKLTFGPWRNAAALALITALAAALRFWRLDQVPPGFHYDEAYEALEAWRVMTQPGYHPIFFPGNFGVEPIFIYLTSLAFRALDALPVVMRGVAALLGTLTVPAVYLLSQELVRADERLAPTIPWLAAAVLATLRWHILFSRVGIEPVLVPLVLCLALWAFWWGLRTNHRGAWVILGVMNGLGPYTYPAGRLLPCVTLALVALVWLADRPRLRGRWRGLLLAGAVAGLTFAPLGWHWLAHPDQLLLRSSQVSVESNAAAAGPWPNLLATLGMFLIRGDMDPRNNVPGMPALDLLMGIPFVLGVLAVLWRWRRPTFTSLLLTGAVMLAPTVLSEYAPHFRRALGASPVVALLCGLGLATILGGHASQGEAGPGPVPPRLLEVGGDVTQLAAQMDRLRHVGRAIIVAAILLGSAVFSTMAYFVRWGESRALYYAYDQGLWEIGQYVLTLPQDELAYISPRPAGDTTLAFAFREGRPVRHFDGRHGFVASTASATPDVATASAPGSLPATYMIIEHEDFRGSRLVQELFPQAAEARRFLDGDGKVYARAWRVPDTRVIARVPEVTFGGAWPGIELLGFDLETAVFSGQQIVYLQLWWHATSLVQAEWTVFVHLLGPAKADGSIVWAAADARPGQGSLPTTTWRPGDLILDEHQLKLPADAPSGAYAIEIGLYDPAQGGQRSVMTEPAGRDHLILGEVAKP